MDKSRGKNDTHTGDGRGWKKVHTPCSQISLAKINLHGCNCNATEAEEPGPAPYQGEKEMGFDKHMALSATVKNKWQIVLLLKFNDM